MGLAQYAEFTYAWRFERLKRQFRKTIHFSRARVAGFHCFNDEKK